MSKKAQNRAIFLTLRPEIKEALEDGWSMLEVWELLHEEKKIDFGYQVLRRLTNSLILNLKTVRDAPTAPKENSSPSKAPVTQSQSKNGETLENPPSQPENPGAIGGFKFTTNLKKEDLI